MLMTLLTTVFAAIISTIVWYLNTSRRELKLSVLCFTYWGASIMWFVDAVFEYIRLREAFFTPAPADVLNDLCLGLSAVALGLIIWLAVLLIHDPKRVIRNALFQKKD